MIDVLHVAAFHDNYIWLPRAGDCVAVVDPGDAEPVIERVEREGLRPVAILCTHLHHDHVDGIAELARRYAVPVYGPAAEPIPHLDVPLDDGDRVYLAELGIGFDVLATPGHTRGHIVFHGDGKLFCGDTLFSAGCGRLRDGTAAQLHASLQRLAALPDTTSIYCAHEYTESNLRFALVVEPGNTDVAEHLARVRARRNDNRPSLPSTLELEKRINPFLRCHTATVRASLAASGMPEDADSAAAFAWLRRWKDGFAG